MSLIALRELPSAPRRFLYFSTINVISWQCLIGHPLILFGRALDMPPAWVGLVIGLLPLSMLLVIFTGPLVEWLGPRRLLTWGWLLRNLFAATVITIPWAIKLWGRPGGWLVLLFATLGFCVFRALSVGGWFPWLHEVLPPHLRGRYLSAETALAQVVTIMVVMVCGTILGQRGELDGFFLIYAVGIGTGMASIALIRRIPGGERQAPVLTGEAPGSSLAPILRDRSYMRFVLQSFFCLAVMTGQSSIAVMYLRDVLLYSDRHIMYLAAAGSLAVALLIGYWVSRAGRTGSTQAMTGMLLTHSFFALAWLCLLPGRPWTNGLALAAVISNTFCNAAFITLATRDMLQRVRQPGRVGYTNVWIIATSLATGAVPILTGLLVDWLGLNGFRL
ncbi:MAG TPA: MFS transporter, partial [Desulfurivibrionaceae bacterium]|nr:MFS transporter [Desulfurivibrionaceae bacterium]